LTDDLSLQRQHATTTQKIIQIKTIMTTDKRIIKFSLLLINYATVHSSFRVGFTFREEEERTVVACWMGVMSGIGIVLLYFITVY
jgi:hypothetical protein